MKRRAVEALQEYKPTVAAIPVRSLPYDQYGHLFRDMKRLNYHVVKHLGTGGLGSVWLIADEKEETYVVKQVSPVDASIEFKILKKLGDACYRYLVCPISLWHGMIYDYLFIEDLSSWQSMHDFIRQYPLKLGSVAMYKRIVCTLVDAVQVMHEKDVVHLDLKPDNIMINPVNGAVKIIDYNLSCIIGECKIYRDHGTEGYIPKELRTEGLIQSMIDLGTPLSEIYKLSDVYSLGATLSRVFASVEVPDSWKEARDPRRDFYDYHLEMSAIAFDMMNDSLPVRLKAWRTLTTTLKALYC